MNCIILGDKFQKGMKSRGCIALFKQQNSTILEEQYTNIKKKWPSSKIVYIYGFDHKRFIGFINKNNVLKENIDIRFNRYYDTYNSIYSLSLAKDLLLEDDCLIISGEFVLNNSFIKKLDTNKGSQIFIKKKAMTEIGCVIHNNMVTNIAYNLDNKLQDIYFLTQSCAKELYNMIDNNNYNNYFIFELINKLIDNNFSFTPSKL